MAEKNEFGRTKHQEKVYQRKRKAKQIITCPSCGWDMELKYGIVVDEKTLNAGMAALGALGFGVMGAIVGASVGKKKKQNMYVCENHTCGNMVGYYTYHDWKKKAIQRGEYVP
jgi:4-hydroxy-3-methylbut-2-en-1-yl diphosphate synthase IspG/GcpE